MLNTFLSNIQVLQKAKALNKLVVFTGAGISFDSGIPTWGGLIEKMKSILGLPKEENDYLKIAQIYFNQRKQKEFVDIVREVLQHKQARYNGLHEAIFDLKPHHIVSTNFDDLLEQVIQSKAFPFSIIKSDNDFPYAASLSYLVKMHGDLNDTEFILKEDDFLDYQNKHPLFEAFIKSVFATQVVLFIGYSFSDLDLKIIINRVRNILGNDFQYAFLLSADKDFSESQRDYLKNKGIIAINYFDAQVDSEQNYIDNYLYQGKNAKNIKHRRNINGLSTKGANLKSLIDFIVHYDSYSQDLLREDILVQIDKSLYRFNELTSLYPEFISNLFPFNINAGSYLHSRNDISIKTNNPDIILKLKDYTIIENNIRQLKTNIINRKASNDEEVLLFKILENLLFSSAYRIEFDSPIKNLILKGDTFSAIDISIKVEVCNCLKCTYDQFKFKEFYIKLQGANITFNSSINDDMIFAYANYKAGKFQVAFNLFEEIASKAWQSGKIHHLFYMSIQ